MIKTIYLAGPEVFQPNAIEIGRAKSLICKKYNFIVRFPLDNEIVEQDSKIETAFLISRTNENLIKSCDAVVANLSPFRGPSADIGTVYEVGFAKALGKYVFGYTTTTKKYYERVCEYDKLAKDGFDSNGDVIENFELSDNLMVPGGIQSCGGFILAKDGENLDIFEELIYKLSK